MNVDEWKGRAEKEGYAMKKNLTQKGNRSPAGP